MIDLQRLVSEATELAPLPASVARLFQLLGDPHYDLADFADIVAFDQALTLRLLRAANSALSAGTEPATTVREAVLRLGVTTTVTLAVAGSARPIMLVPVPAYGLGEAALWRHSVAAAVAAEVLPAFCEVPAPPETFTAALLHDVGKLIMGRFLSPEIRGFIQRAQEVDGLDRLAAETLILNANHAEIGGLVAQHWKLPERVVRGISYHHAPAQGGDVICDYTYLANLLARHVEAGLDGRTFQAELDPDVTERLGLPAADLAPLVPAAAQRYTDVSQQYHAA